MQMKKLSIIFLSLILSLTPVLIVQAQDSPQPVQDAGDALFQVGRLVIAGSIENLEPVGVVDAFAASTERVYCFLEARKIMEDTTAHFIWYHGETQVADVALPLRKGARWRTYSSKNLGGRTGDWRVEIQDADGRVLEVIGFAVE